MTGSGTLKRAAAETAPTVGGEGPPLGSKVRLLRPGSKEASPPRRGHTSPPFIGRSAAQQRQDETLRQNKCM